MTRYEGKVDGLPCSVCPAELGLGGEQCRHSGHHPNPTQKACQGKALLQGLGQGSSAAVLNMLNNIISEKVYVWFFRKKRKGLGLSEHGFTKINKFHLLNGITTKVKETK